MAFAGSIKIRGPFSLANKSNDTTFTIKTRHINVIIPFFIIISLPKQKILHQPKQLHPFNRSCAIIGNRIVLNEISTRKFSKKNLYFCTHRSIFYFRWGVFIKMQLNQKNKFNKMKFPSFKAPCSYVPGVFYYFSAL